MILDPKDPEVVAAAKKNGIPTTSSPTRSARRSTSYVKDWELALPLHAEYRTLPMLFYVPPLLPVMAENGDNGYDTSIEAFLGSSTGTACPLQYMASLFGAGNEGVVRYALRKQLAVRNYRRAVTVGDIDTRKRHEAARRDGRHDRRGGRHLLPHVDRVPDDRFVIPPMHREEAIEMLDEPLEAKGFEGFGRRTRPVRGA